MPKLLNLKQIVEQYPFFTINKLRWIIRDRLSNGFPAFKLGKEYLIDEMDLLKWIEKEKKRQIIKAKD